MADIDNIELRSEKTRQIIGMVPSCIVRYGTLIITLVIAVLLAISYYVPYPENLQTNVVVIDADRNAKACAYIPYSYVNAIKDGMSAEIEFEGYPSADYGYMSAIVSHIDKNVCSIDGHNCFMIELNIQIHNNIELYGGMNGTANILISDQSLLKKLLGIK